MSRVSLRQTPFAGWYCGRTAEAHSACGINVAALASSELELMLVFSTLTGTFSSCRALVTHLLVAFHVAIPFLDTALLYHSFTHHTLSRLPFASPGDCVSFRGSPNYPSPLSDVLAPISCWSLIISSGTPHFDSHLSTPPYATCIPPHTPLLRRVAHNTRQSSHFSNLRVP